MIRLHPTSDLLARPVMSGSLTRLRQFLTGPQVLAFLPAVTLAAYWTGGEIALVLSALGLPLLLAAVGTAPTDPTGAQVRHLDAASGLQTAEGFDRALEQVLEQTSAETGPTSACLVFGVDEFDRVCEQYGLAAGDTLIRSFGDRLMATFRSGDALARLEGATFATCLDPSDRLDLEAVLQICGRAQEALEAPVMVGGHRLIPSVSVGFCLRRRCPGSTGHDWLDAADTALGEARAQGPSAIRSFGPAMMKKRVQDDALREEVSDALSEQQIRAWFQPQIEADTGRISGFEALARWQHPQHGLIGPDRFLPLVREAGMLTDLGTRIVKDALQALQSWDRAGHRIDSVSINFSGPELADPRLPERLAWELEQSGIDGKRLSVEILETVIARGPEDMIVRTVQGLSKLGCRIELDDFGTGTASIAAMRRFDVERIKIDRSFVQKADRDPELQRMVAAILSLAERLELDTVAEGVETVGEHALMAQLGCGHVQGFGIARPMPLAETHDWIVRHAAKLSPPPKIGGPLG